jgi:hypothetical protein
VTSFDLRHRIRREGRGNNPRRTGTSASITTNTAEKSGALGISVEGAIDGGEPSENIDTRERVGRGLRDVTVNRMQGLKIGINHLQDTGGLARAIAGSARSCFRPCTPGRASSSNSTSA